MAALALVILLWIVVVMAIIVAAITGIFLQVFGLIFFCIIIGLLATGVALNL